jgi:preprotein translocase subunit SecE
MKKLTRKDIFFALITALAAVIIFSLGYFISNLLNSPAGRSKPPIVVERITDDSNYIENRQTFQEGEVVASVNSDKFHYLHCPGAKTIKEENKIYFPSAQEAIKAGFVLAGNCK